MHCSRSAPVIPAHWLGVAPAADEPPPEALLPEALSLGDELLGELVLGDEPLPAALPPAEGVEPVVASELPPLLVLPLLIPAPEPDDPALPAALPPEDCAHDAVPKPIKAAVTAALIALTIMVRFL